MLSELRLRSRPNAMDYSENPKASQTYGAVAKGSAVLARGAVAMVVGPLVRGTPSVASRPPALCLLPSLLAARGRDSHSMDRR